MTTHMNNLSRTVILCFALLALTFVAAASPVNVTFTGTGSDPSNGSTIVGPYTLTIGTGPDAVSVQGTCVTFAIDITVGQSWLAEDVSVSSFSLPIQKQLEEAEYLRERFAVAPQADWAGIHQAIWDIFGATFSFDLSDPNQTDTGYWLNLAQLNYGTVNPSSFSVLVPEPGYTLNQGVAQSFLVSGNPGSTPTPEPASLLFLGTGLIALSCMTRRLVRQ